MATRGASRWVIALLFLQACWAAVQAQAIARQDASLNYTSRVEDYITENQRQYATNIRDYRTQLDELRKNYEDQLNTVSVQTAQVEEQLRLIEDKLNPLELLDDMSKHCVQKYRYDLAIIESIKTSVGTCVSSATSYLSTVTSNLVATMTNLNNYYNINLKAALNDCTKKHPTSPQNYTICVTQAISAANVYTANNRETFSTYMTKARNCDGDSRIQQALKCSFSIFYSTISTIGRVTSSIENCIAGVGLCPPCSQQGHEFCDRLVYMDIREVDVKNQTIRNPLYGSNEQLSCLELVFNQAVRK